MRINGAKYLNNNWYETIMIRNMDNGIQVDVKSKTKPETIKNEFSFTQELKDLTDKDRISEIIRYFLRNNKIKYIGYNSVPNHHGKFFSIIGSRNLYINVDKEYLDERIISEIFSYGT